jgi:hypothetical protein
VIEESGTECNKIIRREYGLIVSSLPLCYIIRIKDLKRFVFYTPFHDSILQCISYCEMKVNGLGSANTHNVN